MPKFFRHTLYAFLMQATLVVPAGAADFSPQIEAILKQQFSASLADAGSALKHGTPEWDAAFEAALNAVADSLPANCREITQVVLACGLKKETTASTAMAPTLVEGDGILIVPFSAARLPRRGDIVAFPTASGGDYVFRIIGLGGETVTLRDGVVEIDGVAAKLEPTGANIKGWDGKPLQLFTETLPGNTNAHLVARNISEKPFAREAENAGPYTIPQGTVFVMGDNRHNAADSRFPSSMTSMISSYVTLDSLQGYASAIYVSADSARIGLKLTERVGR